MEKMMWAKPEMSEVTFAANEYVAACGDSGISGYKFTCDAAKGNLYYYSNEKVQAGANVPESFSGNATYLGSYSPCKDKHDTDDSTDFYWGYVDYDKDETHDKVASNGSVIETVIVWIERGFFFYDGHATTNLDMTTWETQKS